MFYFDNAAVQIWGIQAKTACNNISKELYKFTPDENILLHEVFAILAAEDRYITILNSGMYGKVDTKDKNRWNDIRHFAAFHIKNNFMRNLLAKNGFNNLFLFNY